MSGSWHGKIHPTMMQTLTYLLQGSYGVGIGTLISMLIRDDVGVESLAGTEPHIQISSVTLTIQLPLVLSLPPA